MEAAARGAAGPRRARLVSRYIGMTVGAGAGALLMIVTVTHGKIDLAWLAWLPGGGVALGCGVFSFRRSWTWGVAAALFGVAATVIVLWLRAPTRFEINQLMQGLATNPWGLANIAVVGVLGVLLGAGWEKRVPADSGEEDEEREEWENE